ncbi:MAG: RHS repeat-associated core domain-containing protein [Archangium sp.]|nr:RHS repeat-associated core domain-containing protein [Archangium sp.]
MLVKPDGTAYHYKANKSVLGAPGPVYFLSSVVNAANVEVLRIAYFGETESVKLPPDFTAFACTANASDQGVPYIKTVSFPGVAANTKLMFQYGLVGSECVLKKVLKSEASGAPYQLVAFSYTVDGTGLPSLIGRTNLADGGVTEAYDYTTGFDRSVLSGNQGLISHQLLDITGPMTSSTQGGLQRSSISVVNNFDVCTPMMGPDVCCSSTGHKTTVRLIGESGDGTTQTTIDSAYHLTAAHQQWRHEPSLFRKEDQVIAGGSFFPTGTEDRIWRSPGGASGCAVNNPGVIWATKNKLNAFTVTPWRYITPDAGPTLPDGGPINVLEQIARLVGSNERDGGNALQREDFSYSYAPSGHQRLDDVSAPSTVSPGNFAHSSVRRATGSSRVEASFRSGFTRQFGGGIVPKTIGTFYKTTRACIGGSDSFGRTVRIEGPCVVASSSATSCLDAIFPVTEVEYYQSGTANEGRLQRVTRFSNGSTCGPGAGLSTQYISYSPEGLPTQISDESGIVSTFTYTGERIASVTVNGNTTIFVYEGDKLILRRDPRGNRERSCYRTSPASPANFCVGGTLTNQLQWRAKYDIAGNWTEMLKFTYSTYDGTLTREERRLNNGTTYGELRYDRYPSQMMGGPVTMEQSGSAANMRSWSRFDGADNRIALSVKYAQSPAFCSTPGLCKWLTYDRANRLAQMDAHPTGASDVNESERSCIEYDSQGHVSRIASGCSVAGGTCPINNVGSSSCSAPVDYLVDDFDNLVLLTFPWTSNSAGREKTEYEYDSFGNVAKYRTPQMLLAQSFIQYTYDQLGRLLEAQRIGSPNVSLYRFAYDNVAPVEANCPALAFGNGKMTLREDSFGKTWYIYDASGRVMREARYRAGTSPGCGTANPVWDQSPDTHYSYNANSDLTSIVYPHGRTVSYNYPVIGAMDRPDSVSVSLWNGSVWSSSPVIDNVNWEPYGGLRAYRLVGSDKSVEYSLQGGLETTPTASTCLALPATGGGNTDGSGRMRGLFVSDGFALGAPNGNVFKQVYTWNTDQLASQWTCHRNGGAPFVETFNYNKLPQLVSKTESIGPNMTTAFNRTRRGNPVSVVMNGNYNCTQDTQCFSASWQADHLFSFKWGSQYGTTCNAANPASGKYNYLYDRDGRRVNSWDESTKYSYALDYAQNTIGAGVDSVFKSVTFTLGGVLAGTYSYYYDAFARRRAKMTPLSTTDEYFYDTGHQMLSDRGNNTSTNEYPEDDYVWLGGRPVMMIRGKFSAASMTRLPDGPSNWCPRDGEQGHCGSFALVTDYLGKPVVMLEGGSTAGTATYQAFGFANRREHRFGSLHNVAGSSSTTVVPPMPPGFDGPLRVLFSRSKFSAPSGVSLAGINQSGLVGDKAHAWSSWQYSGTNSWTIAWTMNAADYGFDIEAYEIQAKQTGTWWAWTPLRFPGHYYDKETELNENWHRYYDPFSGRYLSPEPMLQKPAYVRLRASDGQAMATYAYAGNNPVRWSDSTGLDFGGDKGTCTADTLKIIEKLRNKLRSGSIKSRRCKKLFDDVGLSELANSDAMHTIFCRKEKGKQECPGAYESVGGDACASADPENYCVRVDEKPPKGCPGIPELVGHELTHNCGAWPNGTAHEEADFKAIEACMREVANEK